MTLNTALLPRPWSCHAPKVEGYEPTIKGNVERVERDGYPKRTAWRTEVLVDSSRVYEGYSETKTAAVSKCAQMMETHTQAHYKSKGEKPVPEATETETHPTLSFDGMGINGPDEYRTRLATFRNPSAAKEWGPLFAAAPDMLVALEAIFPLLMGDGFIEQHHIDAVRKVISKAKATL